MGPVSRDALIFSQGKPRLPRIRRAAAEGRISAVLSASVADPDQSDDYRSTSPQATITAEPPTSTRSIHDTEVSPMCPTVQRQGYGVSLAVRVGRRMLSERPSAPQSNLSALC
jgi:hypothetical protein